jgi:hypothetical protein
MKKNGWIPLPDEKRKRKLKWQYTLLLLVFLAAGHVAKSIHDERTLKIVKEYMPMIKSAINQLSPREKKHFNYLRHKILEIYRKYLTEEEYTDWMAINRKLAKTTATVDELNRGISYRNKVFSNTTSDKKRLINEWEQLGLKLSGYKK